jgi:hypothetical protein
MDAAALQVTLDEALQRAADFPDLRGVDYGYVFKDGERLAEAGIRFHVAKKRSPADLRESEMLPRTLNEFRVDVIEASYALQAPIDPRRETNPLLPGLSIGNINRQNTGTLGAIVEDALSGRSVLSNWHVLAGVSAARGERICQPGPKFLGPRPARVVAHLDKWISPETGVDAAIATLAPGLAYSNLLANADMKIDGVADPYLGMKLVKSGSSSAVTYGSIDGLLGRYFIDYRRFGLKSLWMQGMRLVALEAETGEISLGGDSGSIWVDATTKQAVALHFGGEDGLAPKYEYALAHPLRAVLDALGVELSTAG